MQPLGPVVGEGRTSTVYALGDDEVVKVPKDHVPDEWLILEARFTEAVRSVGAPAPDVHEVTEIDGGSTDEVADVVLYLLSDASSFLTGINLEISGGGA